MKILILVITITWSFGGGYQNAPTATIVHSVDEAAMIVYNDTRSVISPEPDHKEYHLYEVFLDLNTPQIVEIKIPKVVIKKD